MEKIKRMDIRYGFVALASNEPLRVLRKIAYCKNVDGKGVDLFNKEGGQPYTYDIFDRESDAVVSQGYYKIVIVPGNDEADKVLEMAGVPSSFKCNPFVKRKIERTLLGSGENLIIPAREVKLKFIGDILVSDAETIRRQALNLAAYKARDSYDSEPVDIEKSYNEINAEARILRENAEAAAKKVATDEAVKTKRKTRK